MAQRPLTAELESLIKLRFEQTYNRKSKGANDAIFTAYLVATLEVLMSDQSAKDGIDILTRLSEAHNG